MAWIRMVGAGSVAQHEHTVAGRATTRRPPTTPSGATPRCTGAAPAAGRAAWTARSTWPATGRSFGTGGAHARKWPSAGRLLPSRAGSGGLASQADRRAGRSRPGRRRARHRRRRARRHPRLRRPARRPAGRAPAPGSAAGGDRGADLGELAARHHPGRPPPGGHDHVVIAKAVSMGRRPRRLCDRRRPRPVGAARGWVIAGTPTAPNALGWPVQVATCAGQRACDVVQMPNRARPA